MMKFQSRRLLAGAAVLSLVGLPAAPSAAEGPTFRCDPGFYQVISGQLAEFDPGAGTYRRIGADLDNYNAMAYRLADGYVYAVGADQLYRIDAAGVRTALGAIGAVGTSYTGAFGDDGLLHVSRGGRNWHTIDIDTLEIVPVPELSQSLGVADITNVNGVFYGVSSRGGLVRIDPARRTVTQLGAVDGLPTHSMAYGAAWSTAGGNLYVGRNSGQIYQITGYSTGSPVATQVGAAPSTNSNDGASCELAPPPPGLADVDGPTPETEPSTPEAQAAADAYADEYRSTPIDIPEPQPIGSGDDESSYAIGDAGLGSGASCDPTVIEDRPPRGPDPVFTNSAVRTVLYDSDFSVADPDSWEVLSGQWELSDGAFAQTETCDYDATVLLGTHAVLDYRWEATLTADAARRGGLLINQQSAATRAGATLIDLADDGRTIRWGSYDARGYYLYIGGEPIEAALSGSEITLAVEVHGADVSIEVNGSVVGTLNTEHAGGLVGLVATRSSVAFTSATLTALPGAANQ